MKKYFYTDIDSTRVYTDIIVFFVIIGFAVGRYTAAKDASVKKYFYTDIDSTRVYTDGSGKKGVSGGFAVGRYTAAKGPQDYSFFTKADSTRVYVPDGGALSKIGGFAVTANNAGTKEDYFNVTGNAIIYNSKA